MESIRCRSERNFVVIQREERPKDLALKFFKARFFTALQGDKRSTNKGPITKVTENKKAGITQPFAINTNPYGFARWKRSCIKSLLRLYSSRYTWKYLL